MATQLSASATPAEKRAHYSALASAYQEKHSVTWREATRQIKKKYPEALEAFGGPVGGTQRRS